MISEILLLVLGCLSVTSIVEVLFAFAMKVRRRDLLIVALAQVVTNPIVVISSNLVSYVPGSYTLDSKAFLLMAGIMEFFAVLVEGLMYKYFFTNYKRINPYALSIILNISSTVIGFAVVLAFSSLAQ